MSTTTRQLTTPLQTSTAPALSAATGTWKRAKGGLAMALFAAGWLALFWPILKWLGQTLGYHAFRLNLLLLLGISGLIVKRWWTQRGPRAAARQPQALLPWIIAALGSAGYLWVMQAWDARIIAATCMGLATYGAMGLWMDGSRWRQGWPAALLLIAALPFGTHLDQLVGFPARVLTAQWSAKLLASVGVGSLSTQSILVLENGIAHVDMPCSGIKSLWSGCLFFLALTWIERARIGLGWLLCGALFIGGLLVANVLRVCALILVAIVAKLPHIAEIIHVPLGVIGFCATGALVYVSFRWIAKAPEAAPAAPRSVDRTPSFARRYLCLACGMWLLVGVRLALPQRAVAAPQKGWSPSINGLFSTHKAQSLTASEVGMFKRHGKTQARKFGFVFGASKRPLRGSLLLVHSRTWRSHHPPELCLAGSGHKVASLHTVQQTKDFSFRYIALQGGKSAVYWYQSPHRATDILMSRILGSLRKGEKQWVMVSILFDRPIKPRSQRAKTLFNHLFQRIHESF